MGLPETREDCALSDRLEIGSEPAKGKVEGAGKLNDAPDELSCWLSLLFSMWCPVYGLSCGAGQCRAIHVGPSAAIQGPVSTASPLKLRPSFIVVARASGGDKWNAIRQAIRARC